MAKKYKNLGTKFSMRVEDDGIGVISTNGGVYMINGVAIEFLNLLNSQKNSNDIIYEMLKKYDVNYSTILQDYVNTLNQLHDYKFLSTDFYEKKIKELDEK